MPLFALLAVCAPQDPCFQPPKTVALAGDKSAALDAADLDGDGAIDLIAAESPLGLRVVLDVAGAASLGAQIALPGTSLNDVVLGDLDGDGKLDFAAADLHLGNGVQVAYGDGAGGFSSPAALTRIGTPSPYALELADFDADGRLDVAAVNYFDEAHGLEIWTQATGAFGVPVAIDTKNYPNGLAVSDVNLDGHADALVATRNGSSVEAFLGDGAGSFPTAVATKLPIEAIGLDADDVDLDGVPDVVVTQPDENIVLLLRGEGTGAFSNDGTDIDAGPRPELVSILDVNGDSLPDLVVGGQSSIPGASLLFAVQPGAFDSPFPVDTGAQSANLLAHDLNGDGRIDLAAGDYAAADVTITLGGCGPTIATVEPTTAADPTAVTVTGEHLDAVTTAWIAGAPAAIVSQSPTSLVLQPTPTTPGFATLEVTAPFGSACAPIELWPTLRSLNPPAIGGVLELEVDQGAIGVYHLAFSTAPPLPGILALPALPATYGLGLDPLQPGFSVLPAGILATAEGAVIPIAIPASPSVLEVHVQTLTWGTCFPISCPASFTNVLTVSFGGTGG